MAGIDTRIDIKGDNGAFFRSMAILYRKETSRAIRHTAYQSHILLKAELISEKPGLISLPTLSNIQRWRVLDQFKIDRDRGRQRGPDDAVKFQKPKGLFMGLNKSGYWPMGGKLAQMIKYKMAGKDPTTSLVGMFGWQGKYSDYGGSFEAGQETRVTMKMRKLFESAGIILRRGTTVIRQPERPVILNFYRGHREWMTNTLLARIRRNVNQAAFREASKFSRKLARSA